MKKKYALLMLTGLLALCACSQLPVSQQPHAQRGTPAPSVTLPADGPVPAQP